MRLLLACLLCQAWAHSWVERMNTAAGRQLQLASVGYARGNVLRTASDFNDDAMTYLLPPNGQTQVFPTDHLCSAGQRQQYQTADSPRLRVGRGETVVLQWNENGHITKPWNNPQGKNGSGEVFVYGTNQSSPSDMLLAIHHVWTADGQGGDGRGHLLYHAPFDDGQCYQYSDEVVSYSAIASKRAKNHPGPGSTDPAQGLNLWCRANIVLPVLPVNTTYTLYWIWDWPFTSRDAPAQLYTTCMDIDIVA
ncbi:hypothetical protein CKM354_001127200 [Cercospora kikuchii]|uniref:DUF7492 domain-containing protein n=1 Tax=Cercospora kikuchii TaxID=84275 RepID=A0A9P3CV90_9PEZI|nr:uncharacterized protein CKM354_001127200 [Cercospora kikuchii]GIZ48202.1 hypothetical protein CKM354_001127200 [Cercospora kikuchii]